MGLPIGQSRENDNVLDHSIILEVILKLFFGQIAESCHMQFTIFVATYFLFFYRGRWLLRFFRTRCDLRISCNCVGLVDLCHPFEILRVGYFIFEEHLLRQIFTAAWCRCRCVFYIWVSSFTCTCCNAFLALIANAGWIVWSLVVLRFSRPLWSIKICLVGQERRLTFLIYFLPSVSVISILKINYF